MRTVVAFAASTFKTAFLSGLIAASSACSKTPAPAADPSGAAPAGAAAPGAAAPGDPGASTPAAATGPEGAPKPGSSSAGSGAAAGSTIATVDSREDAHWVQADDYFVTRRAYTSG